MTGRNAPTKWLRFILSIILPTLLAISVSIATYHFVVLPEIRKNLLADKQEMLRQLTSVAWFIADDYHQQWSTGTLTEPQARARALETIENLRYGEQNKDYFWVNDLNPILLMHPYSKELIGQDLTEYSTPSGDKLFQQILAAVEEEESGFLDYVWHKKYNDDHLVNKLSHVRKFQPWGWVIGTGVFLDDVDNKIASITNRFSKIIYYAIAAITSLLLYVTLSSARIERERRRAENLLQQAKEQYRLLVEHAVEPVMMVHSGRVLYANNSLIQLTGYEPEELEKMDLAELVNPRDNQTELDSILNQITLGTSTSVTRGEFRVELNSAAGSSIPASLNFSERQVAGKKVFVISVREITERENSGIVLGEDAGRSDWADKLGIGLFRTSATKRLRILDANSCTAELLDLSSVENTVGKRLLEVAKPANPANVLHGLFSKDAVQAIDCLVRTESGGQRPLALSLVLNRSNQGDPLSCTGLLIDRTRERTLAIQRENLIVELQSSLLFLNRPIHQATPDFISCGLHTPAREAAQLMTTAHRQVLLVQDESGEMIGLIDDAILRERLTAAGQPDDVPVFSIMSSPLNYIDDTAQVFEAMLRFQEDNVQHLVIRDTGGRITGVVSSEDLLDDHRYSAAFLLNEIRNGKSVTEIKMSHERLPAMVKALVDSGAHAKNITRTITSISDAILTRLIDLAIARHGEPPVQFAFICLGSEGRGEQTLATDQDNALIYEDVDPELHTTVATYFNQLSTSICTWLDEVGYDFCDGGIMAMNEKWCQPLSVWKSYFAGWIAESAPDDLMEACIFFDFRILYGNPMFTAELREYVNRKSSKNMFFFNQLLQNTLLFKIPLDIFGKISADDAGEHANTINIKDILSIVTGFARVHAIRHGVDKSHTLHRFTRLEELGAISKVRKQELEESYNFLMQLRFKHQVRCLQSGRKPDNHVPPEHLSQLEKEMLRKVCSQIADLRKQLIKFGRGDAYFY